MKDHDAFFNGFGFGGILIVFAGLFFKPQFVIPKSKISLILCAIAPKIFCTAFRGTFSPDSIACLAFLLIDLAIIGYLMLQSALVYNRQIVE